MANPSAPGFRIALAVEIGIFAGSIGWAVWRRKKAAPSDGPAA